MEVEKLTIENVFERQVIYLIPLYQRPYVWTEEEQWKPLWEDLQRLAEIILDGKQPHTHFLGAAVQDRPSGRPSGHIETFRVIDGQQRLTTVQFVLKAFENVVRLNGDQRYHEAIEQLLYNSHPLSTKPHERFKIWPTNADREDYQKVMECNDRESLLEEYGIHSDKKSIERSVPDAYLFFEKCVQNWINKNGPSDATERTEALYSAIRNNVRLIVIDIDEKDNAQLIFETLNARGTPLLAADLVKNSLMNEIESNGIDAEEAYAKYWQSFDVDFQFWRREIGRGHARRARIEIFLRHALTLMAKEEVLARRLYTAYRNFLVSEHAGSAEERLANFQRYGQIYKNLIEGHENPQIRLFLIRLHIMGIETAYPFLIKLFDTLNNEDLIIKTLKNIESFLVRRMVCRLSTRAYGNFFVKLTTTLNVQPEQIPNSVQDALLSSETEDERWPTDEEYKKSWINGHLPKHGLRLLLGGLEMELRQRDKFVETQDVPHNLTIEHIMPQKWEEFWPLPDEVLEADARERRNHLIQTIGNLTLLTHKLNASQSNRPWMTDAPNALGKRDLLKEHSVLFLNKKVCEESHWNEQTIASRSSELFNIAQKVWSRPKI